jgi:hypothetical protein
MRRRASIAVTLQRRWLVLQPSRVFLDSSARLMTGDASITASHTLKNAFVGLVNAPFTYDPEGNGSDVLANEANYPGYAKQSISSWSGPFVGQGGFSLFDGGAHLFQPTGSDTANTIYGQFLVGSDSVTILGVEFYDGPIPLPNAETGFVTTVIVGYGPNTKGYGSSIVTN